MNLEELNPSVRTYFDRISEKSRTGLPEPVVLQPVDLAELRKQIVLLSGFARHSKSPIFMSQCDRYLLALMIKIEGGHPDLPQVDKMTRFEVMKTIKSLYRLREITGSIIASVSSRSTQRQRVDLDQVLSQTDRLLPFEILEWSNFGLHIADSMDGRLTQASGSYLTKRISHALAAVPTVEGISRALNLFKCIESRDFMVVGMDDDSGEALMEMLNEFLQLDPTVPLEWYMEMTDRIVQYDRSLFV